MSTTRFRPFVEPLENRLTPAGNVTARVIGGSLVVTGDAANNAVLITQPAPGRFTITGEEETTVNGAADPVTLRANLDVRFALAAGDDRVRFGRLLDDTVAIGRDLVVADGPGTNALETVGTLTVGRDLTVTNPAVGTTFLDATMTVGGDLTVTNGPGNSLTVIVPFSTDTNSIGGDLRITNGAGDHFNQVEDTNVGGDVVFDNTGQSEFTFTINFFTTADSPGPLAVGGDVRYLNRAIGGGINNLTGTDVRGQVAFSNPGLGFQNHQIASSSVAGDVTVVSGGQGNVRFTDAALGGLGILTGTGDDVIELSDVSVRRLTAIATGGGADRVTIDDATFFGPFLLATGPGNDVVQVESGTDPTQDGRTEFRGLVGVFLGEGDDSLQLGVAGDPTRLVRVRAPALFDGGPDTDVFEAGNVDAPAGFVTSTNFEV